MLSKLSKISSMITLSFKCPSMFDTYIKDYNKSYSLEEYGERLIIFCENVKEIEEMNEFNGNYTVGINKFTDMTDMERAGMINNAYKGLNLDFSNDVIEFTGKYDKGDVNWIDVMPPVRNQGQCGSCYSFGALESIEARYKQNLNKTVSLSEGEIIDCSYRFGNMRCNGGMPDRVFEYIKEYGVCQINKYPYSIPFELCNMKACKEKERVYIKGWVDVNSFDEDALTKAVNEGPVSVAIDASNLSPYTGGIFTDCSSKLDHAVVVYGYGITEDGKKFWRMRNSWGEDWGDNGNFMIPRATGSIIGGCGINSVPSYPIV